jgi:galactokinase
VSEEAVESKAALLRDAYAGLATGGGRDAADARAFWVPGRVEFLGKHTDYAGGRSLLCAIERGICIVAAPRADRRLRIVDARLGESVEGAVDPDVRAAEGHWSTYPFTVARRIARDFGDPLLGADVAFTSDLPPASGMSSSSALVVATFLALADVNQLASRDAYRRAFPRPEALAGYLGAVENGYSFEQFAGDTGVGTFGGSEDHTAILCARPDALIQYSFCPVRFERHVPLPKDHELVLASCGVVAEKIGGAREAYNRLSRSTQELASRWRQLTGRDDATLGDALASSSDATERLLAMAADCDDELRERLEQFVRESGELIPRSGDALLRGDLEALSALIDRSQEGAERLLKNQIDETVWLVRDARKTGAVAASAFGAGFGGAVWALVPSAGANSFRSKWSERYAARFPSAAEKASFFVTRAGPAAANI